MHDGLGLGEARKPSCASHPRRNPRTTAMGTGGAGWCG